MRKSVRAYTVVYSKNFGSATTGCHSELPSSWMNPDSTFVEDCDGTCYFDPDTTNIASVLLMSQDSIDFNITIPSVAPYFSQVGAEVTFLAFNYTPITLDLNGASVVVTPDPSDNVVLTSESALVNCGATQYISYAKVNFTNTTDLVSDTVTLRMTKYATDQVVGIRSILLWTNCGNNCKTCYNSTECASCNDYGLYTFSNGARRCRQSYACDTYIPNCAVCYNYNSTMVCTTCYAGYVYSSSTKSCVAYSANNNCIYNGYQYADETNTCQMFSTIGYYEDSVTGVYMQYSGSYDLSVFRCLTYETVLAPARQNYSQKRCGCKLSNCKKCTDTTTCVECTAAFELINSNTQCKYRCSAYSCFNYSTNVCQACKPNCSYGSSTECGTCDSGYFIDPYNKQYCILCQVANCATCVLSPANPYQCKVCNSNFALNSTTYQCEQIHPDNIATITQTVVDVGYVFTLTFSTGVGSMSGYDISALFEVTLADGSVLPSKITQVTTDTVQLTVSPTVTLRGFTATITFINSTYNDANFFKPTEYSQDLADYNYVSTDQREATKTTESITNTVTSTIVAAIIPTVLLSNFYILINTIDLTGFLYYLLFVKIRYPDNIIVFYEAFKNFQFPFIPNYFERYIADDNVQEAPQKFEENGTQLLFLSNSGQSATIFFAIMLIYAIGKMFSYSGIPVLAPYLKKSMSTTWEYNAFFDLIWTLYIYLVVGAMVQFYCIDLDNEIAVLNYSIHFFFAFIVTASPLLVVFLLFKQKNIKSNAFYKVKLLTLVGGVRLFDEEKSTSSSSQSGILSENNPQKNLSSFMMEESSMQQQKAKNQEGNNLILEDSVSVPSTKILKSDESSVKSKREIRQMKYTKLYVGVLYMRKFLFSAIIVYMHDYPYHQLTTISLLNILVAAYIFYIQPLDKPSENYKNGIGELILVGVQTCGYFLIEDEEYYSENDRMNIGWVIIGLSSFILLWFTLQIIWETLVGLFVWVKQRFVPKSNAVHHFDSSKKSDAVKKQPQDLDAQSIRNANDKSEQQLNQVEVPNSPLTPELESPNISQTNQPQMSPLRLKEPRKRRTIRVRNSDYNKINIVDAIFKDPVSNSSSSTFNNLI